MSLTIVSKHMKYKQKKIIKSIIKVDEGQWFFHINRNSREEISEDLDKLNKKAYGYLWNSTTLILIDCIHQHFR